MWLRILSRSQDLALMEKNMAASASTVKGVHHLLIPGGAFSSVGLFRGSRGAAHGRSTTTCRWTFVLNACMDSGLCCELGISGSRTMIPDANESSVEWPLYCSDCS